MGDLLYDVNVIDDVLLRWKMHRGCDHKLFLLALSEPVEDVSLIYNEQSCLFLGGHCLHWSLFVLKALSLANHGVRSDVLNFE